MMLDVESNCDKYNNSDSMLPEIGGAPEAKPQVGVDCTQCWTQKDNSSPREFITAGCIQCVSYDLGDFYISNQKKRASKTKPQYPSKPTGSTNRISKPQRQNQKQEHIRTLENRIQRLESVLTAYFKYYVAAPGASEKLNNHGSLNASVDVADPMVLDRMEEEDHDADFLEAEEEQERYGEDEEEHFDGDEYEAEEEEGESLASGCDDEEYEEYEYEEYEHEEYEEGEEELEEGEWMVPYF
ncbi:hypothetical protein RUND412_008430 [Rhizina undulata]